METCFIVVRQYDIICLEDLNIKGMQRLYGRKISDLAFSSFVNKLLWQAEKHHKIVVFVDRYYASSQICSRCGDRNHALIDLGIRDWTCPKCHTYHDRDFNAAKNILREGLRILRGRASSFSERICQTAAMLLDSFVSEPCVGL